MALMRDVERERLAGITIQRPVQSVKQLDKHTHAVQANGKTICRILTTMGNPMNPTTWVAAPRSTVPSCGKCRRVFDSLIEYTR